MPASDAIQQGLVLMVSGMLGVFIGLGALFLFMNGISLLISRLHRKKLAEVVPAVDQKEARKLSGEVVAAIAAATYLDLRTLDEEQNLRITIQKVTRPFGPWFNSGKASLISDWSVFNSGRWNR